MIALALEYKYTAQLIKGRVERFPFDESYLQCLRNRDFPTEQHFVAYFNKLLPIKLCSRLDSSRLSLQTRVALLTLPPAREIDSLVQSYRAAVVGPRDMVETDNVEGQKLYE